MSEKYLRLICMAKTKYGSIFPCRQNGRELAWEKCFSVENGKFMLWFNTDDDSTHIECLPDEKLDD